MGCVLYACRHTLTGVGERPPGSFIGLPGGLGTSTFSHQRTPESIPMEVDPLERGGHESAPEKKTRQGKGSVFSTPTQGDAAQGMVEEDDDSSFQAADTEEDSDFSEDTGSDGTGGEGEGGLWEDESLSSTGDGYSPTPCQDMISTV